MRYRNGMLVLLTVAAAGMVWVDAQSGAGQVTSSLRRVSPPNPPYTAEFKTTNLKTLSNGITLTQVSNTVEVRDAQGRTRIENVTTPAYSETEVHSIAVYDPATRTRTWWDARTKVAHVSSPPPGSGGQAQTCAAGAPIAHPAAPANALRDDVKRESLGSKTIFDVRATGTRTTTTVPTGARGNDAPLIITADVWTAPGFQSPLEEHRDSPEEGIRTKELTNLTLGAPDPALFSPPADYEIVHQETAVPCTPPARSATPLPQSN
jgi:hypothetical protein